jgi:hypothetical protein
MGSISGYSQCGYPVLFKNNADTKHREQAAEEQQRGIDQQEGKENSLD